MASSTTMRTSTRTQPAMRRTTTMTTSAWMLCAALALSSAALSSAAAISTSQEQQAQVVFQSSAEAASSLYRIQASSMSALSSLRKKAMLPAYDGLVDIWSAQSAGCSGSNRKAGKAAACALDVASSPEALQALLGKAELNSYNVTTVIADVGDAAQRHLDAARQLHMQSYGDEPGPDYGEDWHDRYHSYEDIQSYLQYLSEAYPSRAQLVQLGTTYEGRQLTAIKLGHFDSVNAHQQGSPRPKLGVFVMANQHAREWISAATALHLVHLILAQELGDGNGDIGTLRKHGKHKSREGREAERKAWAGGQDLLDIFDITILPLANPDGYAYSWEAERMWRKNRQPVGGDQDASECIGIDVNSNWDAHFQPWPTSRACSEGYPGSEPFEAYESRAIARFIAEPANQIRSVVDLHSYGQLLTYPFAFSCSPSLNLPDEEDLLELSYGAIRAMRDVHSRTFHAGRHCELAWELRGSALDWSYGLLPAPGDDGDEDEAMRSRLARNGTAKAHASTTTTTTTALVPRQGNLVKWSFALELRDGGTYGFLLPPEQIKPSGHEAGALMRYTLEFIAKREHRL